MWKTTRKEIAFLIHCFDFMEQMRGVQEVHSVATNEKKLFLTHPQKQGIGDSFDSKLYSNGESISLGVLKWMVRDCKAPIIQLSELGTVHGVLAFYTTEVCLFEYIFLFLFFLCGFSQCCCKPCVFICCCKNWINACEGICHANKRNQSHALSFDVKYLEADG